MKKISIVKTVLKLALVSVVGLLVACSSSSDSTPPADASISGIITAAPVNGADVSVVDANGNVVVEAVKTNATGQYTLVIPNGSLGQDLIVKSTGGTFTDEATGNKDVPAGEMLAYVAANSISNGSSISATPGSTIIANIVMNPDTNVSLAEAEAAFDNAFGYTPDLSVTPAVATTVPAVDETGASTLASFRAAAFSQLALDLGLKSDQQFAMFSALVQDLSDDKLDGVDASGAVDIGTTGFKLEANIQNRFATALINFHANANNLTELNSAQIGNLPFGKIAFTTDDVNNTSTYQIEYKPLSMMDPMEGKSTFQVHITDRITSDGVTGLVPMLMPMMHMAIMTHSSPKPVVSVIEDANGNGLYTVTLYYLMASQMMDGTSMGYWDLIFTVNGEKAHFYPAVMMAMGDTVLAKLKGVVDLGSATDVNLDGEIDIADLDGVADIIKNMDGSFSSRTYIIFKDSLEGTGPSYTFTMFIAAKEDMMSFPALVTPGTLTSGMGGTPLDITSIGVNVSANDGGPVPASDNGDGTWDITLPLNDGIENQIRIMLTVNNEVKTTNGMTQDAGVNDYQTFTVTPGGM